jgi:hypothetical protein
MSEGRIKLRINGLGQPTIEAEGFTGTACTAATAGIEKALSGGEGKSVKVLKPEFYEHETEENKVSLYQGY